MNDKFDSGGFNIILIIILIYLSTAAFSYYGNRRFLIHNGLDADGVITLATFIPLVNIIWGLLSFLDTIKGKIEIKINYNKFFMITENDN